MAEVHIFAIFYPANGKAARMEEVLAAQCSVVHQREDYALRFILTKEIDTQSPHFCLFETYGSVSATVQHTGEPHFKEMLQVMQSENLMERPPTIIKTATRAGFELDRCLISAA